MTRQYRCISGDGHIDLNPDIWRERVQAKFRERAPKRVKMTPAAANAALWICGDTLCATGWPSRQTSWVAAVTSATLVRLNRRRVPGHGCAPRACG